MPLARITDEFQADGTKFVRQMGAHIRLIAQIERVQAEEEPASWFSEERAAQGNCEKCPAHDSANPYGCKWRAEVLGRTPLDCRYARKWTLPASRLGEFLG